MSPWLSDLVLSSQSDERLVSLARAGYDRAFVAIFERYKRRLLAFAIQLGSGSRAEDVVQQAFLSAFAALRDQREVLHLSGWLHQTVRNTSIQMVGRAPAESVLDTDTLSAENIEEQVQSRLEAHAVLANLADLPERQRSALIQTALAGESRSEIALSMGLTEGAVRQLVHRARATLRSAAAALLPFPVVAWAARAGGGVAGAELGPITAGAASTGGGLLVKTGAIIAATGLVATGVVVSHTGHRHLGARPRHSAAASLLAQAPGNRDGTNQSRQEGPNVSRGSALPGLQPAVQHRPMPRSSANGQSPPLLHLATASDSVAGTGIPASTRRGSGSSHNGSGLTEQQGGGSSSGQSGGSQRTGGSAGHDGSQGSTSTSGSGSGGGTSLSSGGGTSSSSGDGTSLSSGDGTSSGSGDGSPTDSSTASGDGSSGSSTTASFTGSSGSTNSTDG